MNLDWTDLPGVVIGGLIAAGAGWVQAVLAKRDRAAQFESEQEALRQQEVRARADLKADEVVAALDDLSRLYFEGRIWGDLTPDLDDRERRTDIRRALGRIEAASIYLGQPVRGNVEAATRILPTIDELYHRQILDGQYPFPVGRTVIAFARDSVASYLRGEQVPSIEPLAQYLRMLDELDAEIDHEAQRQERLAAEHDAEREANHDGGDGLGT